MLAHLSDRVVDPSIILALFEGHGSLRSFASGCLAACSSSVGIRRRVGVSHYVSGITSRELASMEDRVSHF
jgi:hypothetical protein